MISSSTLKSELLMLKGKYYGKMFASQRKQSSFYNLLGVQATLQDSQAFISV